MAYYKTEAVRIMQYRQNVDKNKMTQLKTRNRTADS